MVSSAAEIGISAEGSHEVHDSTAATPGTLRAGPEAAMRRVLVVDDNVAARYLLRTMLEAHGFAVEEAANGAEALDRARRDPPALVLSDLLMPRMDGFLLCRQWKADERLRRVPFVVYTATYRDPRDEQLARSLGADDFILKPEPSAVLIPRLRAALARGAAAPHEAPGKAPDVLLEQYNAALVRKLEAKVEEFERERVRGRETEQRLSLALAAGAMGWWDWDLESGAIVWSDEHARLFGMQPGEFDGRYESFRNRLYPDDIEGVETAVDEARTQRTLYQREYRVIWLNRGSPLRDHGGAAREPRAGARRAG